MAQQGGAKKGTERQCKSRQHFETLSATAKASEQSVLELQSTWYRVWVKVKKKTELFVSTKNKSLLV